MRGEEKTGDLRNTLQGVAVLPDERLVGGVSWLVVVDCHAPAASQHPALEGVGAIHDVIY